ncbi:MAG TPA: hypothetical protein VHA52_10030 [Candidatus Babeliaceae bacterium]|nr:hypothetical protein [Candidatus Babeliaceae bacterium]
MKDERIDGIKNVTQRNLGILHAADGKRHLMGDSKRECSSLKFAAGGVAKIRHNQSTASGAPKSPHRRPGLRHMHDH